jgi:hypothetical protein
MPCIIQTFCRKLLSQYPPIEPAPLNSYEAPSPPNKYQQSINPTKIQVNKKHRQTTLTKFQTLITGTPKLLLVSLPNYKRCINSLAKNLTPPAELQLSYGRAVSSISSPSIPPQALKSAQDLSSISTKDGFTGFIP